jgi:hypothetical protein
VNQQPGQNPAGKALVASGAVMVLVGVILAFAVSPWGGIVAVVGVFDILIGQAMLRGMLGSRSSSGTGAPE